MSVDLPPQLGLVLSITPLPDAFFSSLKQVKLILAPGLLFPLPGMLLPQAFPGHSIT